MHLSIGMDENGAYWVDTGHADAGPFDNVLEASAHIVRIIADRAKAEFGNNVYFLEGTFK